jgi:hypothetical protein
MMVKQTDSEILKDLHPSGYRKGACGVLSLYLCMYTCMYVCLTST